MQINDKIKTTLNHISEFTVDEHYHFNASGKTIHLISTFKITDPNQAYAFINRHLYELHLNVYRNKEQSEFDQLVIDGLAAYGRNNGGLIAKHGIQLVNITEQTT